MSKSFLARVNNNPPEVFMNLYKCTIWITRFRESDHLLINSLSFLALQKWVNADVIVVDQGATKNSHIEKLIFFLNSKNIHFHYIHKVDFSGLSEVRNFFLKESREDIVLFLDCDAVPADSWAQSLCAIFDQNKSVSICGTKILPFWLGKTYSFHLHPLVSCFYSMLDLWSWISEVRRIVWASFAVHKKRLYGLEFSLSFGRSKGNFLWGEETDLCRRIRSAWWKIVYSGETYVYHYITQNRLNTIWLIKSVFYAGWSKWIFWEIPDPNINKTNWFPLPLNPIVYWIIFIYILWYWFSWISQSIFWKR